MYIKREGEGGRERERVKKSRVSERYNFSIAKFSVKSPRKKESASYKTKE